MFQEAILLKRLFIKKRLLIAGCDLRRESLGRALKFDRSSLRHRDVSAGLIIHNPRGNNDLEMSNLGEDIVIIMR